MSKKRQTPRLCLALAGAILTVLATGCLPTSSGPQVDFLTPYREGLQIIRLSTDQQGRWQGESETTSYRLEAVQIGMTTEGTLATSASFRSRSGYLRD